MAKLTFSLIRQMMRFAETRDIIENDPTHKIDKKQIGGSSVERDRVLCATDDKPDELKDLFSKIPNSGLNDASKAGLYICLATCCRIGELLKAKWENVDLETRYWLIPDEISKNGKPHSIYLNDLAIEHFKLLQEISNWSIWLYPSTKAIEGKTMPVGTRTITKQVSDRQREEGGNLKNRTKKSQSLILSNGRWTPHDLRRTGATLMVELGVMPEVVERCLNHTEENKVKRIYQRYSYKSEMKAGWELLGIRLLVLRDGDDNVIPLKNKTQKAL
jgi:integrase